MTLSGFDDDYAIIKLSSGEYICFVDSDDKLTKGSVNNILNHIKNYYDKELFILRYFILKFKKTPI